MYEVFREGGGVNASKSEGGLYERGEGQDAGRRRL